MNNPVNFETAKLLKEKGFDVPAADCYNLNGLLFSNGWCEYIADDHEFDGLIYPNKLKEKDVLAPTIAEVVMWLYEKHGVWIISDWSQAKWCYSIIDIKEETIRKVSGEKWSERSSGVYLNTGLDFKSPTEAYEAAIIYTLKNLL